MNYTTTNILVIYEMASLLLLLLLLLIPVLLLLRIFRKQNKSNRNLPPSPPRLPILGNIHQLGTWPHQSFRKLAQKYGPVMSFNFGRVPFVIISSPEAAKEVLKTHDLETCSRAPLIGSKKITYNFSDIVFSPYGEYWRQIRKLCVLEIFSLKRIQSYGSIRQEEIKSLMDSLSQSSGSVVNVSEKLFALTAGILFRMAYGISFKGCKLDTSNFRFLMYQVNHMMGSFSAQECFPYVGWMVDWMNGYQVQLQRIYDEMNSFFDQVIDEHLKTDDRMKAEHSDIVDVMLKIRANIKGDDVPLSSLDHVKGILLNMFLGGIDTSSITVLWAMSELSRDPRVMSKAQEEIRSVVGKNGKVTEEDLEQLPYLKMVIKETLRLHPPAPLLLFRQAMKDININGFDIEKGTVIQVNVYAIGRDPKYWKDSEMFYPERFIDNPIDFRGHDYEYLPFGSGRRICPGINLGVLTSELTLANILYRFDWKLPSGIKPEDVNMEETVGQCLTVAKKEPLNLVPVDYLQ